MAFGELNPERSAIGCLSLSILEQIDYFGTSVLNATLNWFYLLIIVCTKQIIPIVGQ